MLTSRTGLSAFAAALAERLPGHWTSKYEEHDSYKQQFDAVEGLWDTGHVDYIVSQYVLSRHAVLHHPDGRQLYIADRPLYRHQFVVAPLEPSGPRVKPHHFVGVQEPNGIAIPNQPARAAARVVFRLLPRYQQALDTVLRNAAVQPEPPHRPGPPQVTDVVTLTWYEDGALGTPYKSVPEDVRTAFYSFGFHYDPHQAAFLFAPGCGPLRLPALVHHLAQKGIGVNLRHTTPPTTAPARRPVPAPTNAVTTARHR